MMKFYPSRRDEEEVYARKVDSSVTKFSRWFTIGVSSVVNGFPAEHETGGVTEYGRYFTPFCLGSSATLPLVFLLQEWARFPLKPV